MNTGPDIQKVIVLYSVCDYHSCFWLLTVPGYGLCTVIGTQTGTIMLIPYYNLQEPFSGVIPPPSGWIQNLVPDGMLL